jgi:hypothetical protein
MNIAGNGQKRALLLHYAGAEVYDIFDSVPADQKGDAADYDNGKKALHVFQSQEKHLI